MLWGIYSLETEHIYEEQTEYRRALSLVSFTEARNTPAAVSPQFFWVPSHHACSRSGTTERLSNEGREREPNQNTGPEARQSAPRYGITLQYNYGLSKQNCRTSKGTDENSAPHRDEMFWYRSHPSILT
jgi:hypothetical protein